VADGGTTVAETPVEAVGDRADGAGEVALGEEGDGEQGFDDEAEGHGAQGQRQRQGDGEACDDDERQGERATHPPGGPIRVRAIEAAVQSTDHCAQPFNGMTGAAGQGGRIAEQPVAQNGEEGGEGKHW
jgi:hypothetical protein